MRWWSHSFIICYQISADLPSALVVAGGPIIKIPYLRWWSSFIYNCQLALWQEHTLLVVGLAILVHRLHMTQEALISTIVQSSAELSPAKRCLSRKINENFFPSDLTFIRICPAKLLLIRISPAFLCFSCQWKTLINQRFHKRAGTIEMHLPREKLNGKQSWTGVILNGKLCWAGGSVEQEKQSHYKYVMASFLIRSGWFLATFWLHSE